MTINSPSPAAYRSKPNRFGPLVLASLLGLGLALPGAGGAQEVSAVADTLPPAPADSLAPPPADSLAPAPGISPKAAFVRAVLFPGWGHASIGSYNRGGFYFAAEITTAWGLLRTARRLAQVRDRVAFREGVIRGELADLGVTEPDEVDAALDADEVLEDLDELVIARQEQREDWAALGIFLLFLAGADAFVSAHLSDFPVPIEIDAVPLPGGRMEVSVGLKLGR